MLNPLCFHHWHYKNRLIFNSNWLNYSPCAGDNAIYFSINWVFKKLIKDLKLDNFLLCFRSSAKRGQDLSAFAPSLVKLDLSLTSDMLHLSLGGRSHGGQCFLNHVGIISAFNQFHWNVSNCGAIGILPYRLGHMVLHVAAPTLQNWNW